MLWGTLSSVLFTFHLTPWDKVYLLICTEYLTSCLMDAAAALRDRPLQHKDKISFEPLGDFASD